MTKPKLLLFWLVLFAMNQIIATEKPDKKVSTIEEMLIGAAAGASITVIAMISAPYIVPVGTVLSAKAAIGAVVTSKVTLATAAKSIFASAVSTIKIAMPIASQINSSIVGIYLIKHCFLPSTEQKIQQLLIEKSIVSFEKELKEISEKTKHND